MSKMWLRRWVPAVLLMAVIFLLSSRPSSGLPNFGSWDYFVKKAGHAFGYGLLALAYWYGLSLGPNQKLLAWGMAICYATTDEIHQIFVPGRHPSPLDVMIFDNLGAMFSLILSGYLVGKTRQT
jgi:VanZ family protein